jgi:hypothetical protein
MAAIKELLGPEMARKLIPHAEAYEQPHRGAQTESIEPWEF